MKFIQSLFILFLSISLISCHPKNNDRTIKLGIIDGPSSAMWEIAQKTALQRYGLHVILVKFSDYNLPNEALNNGDIDANAFQHRPFLEAQIKSHGYALIPVANTFLYPIAMYSDKIKKLNQIKAGDKVAIPNDPSNEARALMLMQRSKLIKLRPGAGINATLPDITYNPKKLRILELDAAQLPRALKDVTAAIITNDYAQPVGLSIKDALIIEAKNSPYMNIIVVRRSQKNDPRIQQLIKSFQTTEVKLFTLKLFEGNAIAGW